MSDELMAAMRDASWFRKPGRAGRYHVVIKRPDGLEAACGQFAFLQRDADAFRSRGAIERAADVALVLRCRRNGCRQRWPEPAPGVEAGAR